MNTDIELLKLSKNYEIAYTIFTDIINHRCPSEMVIERLYGKEKAKIIQVIIRDYILNKRMKRIPRPHNYKAPNEILIARREIENDIEYQKIHSMIIMNKLPDIKYLEKFYGNYSKYVLEIIKIYTALNLKRKCEINAFSHLNRVGAIVYQLKMNDTGLRNYSTIAVMHDAIEDLLMISKLEKNNSIDINKYNYLIDIYIPKDLQKSIKILTNYYHLILDYIFDKLEEEDKACNVKNILCELEKIGGGSRNEFTEYAEKIINLLSSFEAEGDIKDDLKWECYKTLYINGIAETTLKKENYRLYEIKGVDLADNSLGKGALSISSRIRNISKNLLWGIRGFSMQSDWKPFNDHIEEIMEDTLQSAEYLIMTDLLQPNSQQDFLMSALQKITKLENVFYI